MLLKLSCRMIAIAYIKLTLLFFKEIRVIRV